MEKTYYKKFKLLCRILVPWGIDSGDTVRLSKEIKNVDWGMLLQLADAYHVSPALYVCLKRKKLIELLDEEVRDFLEGIYELNYCHNKLLKNEAIGAIRLLNSYHVQPILLKGMAGLMTGLYENDGERIIGDIDLLIDLSELPGALRVLLDHGYHCDKGTCDQVFSSAFYKHELTIMTKSWAVKIDLHVRPTGPSGGKAFVSTDGARSHAEVLELYGVRFVLPSPLFRLMHNFYHAQYLDRSYLGAAINLRQLIDWVKLWQRYGDEVGVSEMARKVRAHGQVRPLRLYTLNAYRYLEMPIPIGVEIGWFEKLLFYRQSLNLNSRFSNVVNGVLNVFLNGVQLVMPERLRLTYGDLPLGRLVYFRVMNLFSYHWYRRRLEDIKQIFGFK